MNNINATSTQNSKDGIKVEVFVPEKKPKKKKKKAPKEPPQPVNKNAFLDLLFSFIGVSSQSNELKKVQRDFYTTVEVVWGLGEKISLDESALCV